MELTLYNYSGDNRIINKILSAARLTYFHEQKDFDFVNPVIRYSSDDVNINNYNYCYIPAFKRYYFIERVEYVAENTYDLHLHCDVLMTYKSYFGSCYGVMVHARKWGNYSNFNNNTYIYSRNMDKSEYSFTNAFNEEGNNILIALKQTSSN